MAKEDRIDRHDEHLGDGVYASFDGYHVNLAVNHHLNHVVALDTDVVQALVGYARLRGMVIS